MTRLFDRLIAGADAQAAGSRGCFAMQDAHRAGREALLASAGPYRGLVNRILDADFGLFIAEYDAQSSDPKRSHRAKLAIEPSRAERDAARAALKAAIEAEEAAAAAPAAAAAAGVAA